MASAGRTVGIPPESVALVRPGRKVTAPLSLPVARSHRMTRPSRAALISSLPPGAKTMLLMAAACSLLGVNNFPEGASHTVAAKPLVDQATTRSLPAKATPWGIERYVPAGGSV